MFMDFRNLINWLDDHMEDDYSIDKNFNKKLETPMRFGEVYKRIGVATVWNEVGCIEYSFDMYAPINGGSIVYNIEGYYDYKKKEYVYLG